MSTVCYWKYDLEIVSFPIKNGGSFHSYVNVYQRVMVYDGLWSSRTSNTQGILPMGLWSSPWMDWWPSANFSVYHPTVDHGASAFSPSKNEVKITGRYQPLSTQWTWRGSMAMGQNMSKPKQTTTVSFRDIRKISQWIYGFDSPQNVGSRLSGFPISAPSICTFDSPFFPGTKKNPVAANAAAQPSAADFHPGSANASLDSFGTPPQS